MPREQNESEKWFEAYCEEQSIEILAYEPELSDTTRRPDYLIARDGVEVVCEIKEFATSQIDALRNQGGAFSFSAEMEFAPIRAQVRQAARSLKPLADSRWPLVVVLANPRRVHAPLDPGSLLEALYGDVGVSFAISTKTGAAVTEPEWIYGRNGRLRSDHPYISAVVGLHRGDRELDWWNDWHARYRAEGPRTRAKQKSEHEIVKSAQERLKAALLVERTEQIPIGHYHYVHVVRTRSETATPLPDDFFSGERDTVWSFSASARGFVRTR